jgi:hypothetical protein
VLREHEAHSALWYFGTWVGRVAIPWHRRDIDRAPTSWCHYPGRRSLTGDKKRHATDPVNAMLSFGYTLGYAEARTACIRAGLDPRLGYFHNDYTARDSLALDVLEAIRAEIDRYVLGLLGLGGTMRTFTHRDFSEHSNPYFPGTCRITAPLTHELAEHSIAWSRTAGTVASDIVRALLAIPVGGRDTIRPARAVSRIAGQARFPLTATVRQIVPRVPGASSGRPSRTAAPGTGAPRSTTGPSSPELLGAKATGSSTARPRHRSASRVRPCGGE